MYEVSRTLLWFEILVVSFPISSIYGRFTWVISINANGDYNVNPPCLSGKIDLLVFHWEPECLRAFMRIALYCNKEDVQVFSGGIGFVHFFTSNSIQCKAFVKKKTKATSPVSHCSLPDAISRVPVWILDSDEKMSLILRNILI